MSPVPQLPPPANADGNQLPLRIATVGLPSRCVTVSEAISLYLPEAKRENSANTLSTKIPILARFEASFGGVAISDLRPVDMQGWLNDWTAVVREWSRRRIVSIVKRVFNWCLDMELIEKNPF